MNEPRTVINLEETIDKQVGRRKPPSDPMRIVDSNIQRTVDFHRAFPCKMPRKGVYRYRSHAEADLWTMLRNQKD